jgi:tetratricopeptide (TPR) repeat protein
MPAQQLPGLHRSANWTWRTLGAWLIGGDGLIGVDLTRARVAVDPKNPWGQRNLGFCLLKAGQAERASVSLQRATELAPKDQAAFLGLAQAHKAQGRRMDADGAFRAVLKIDEFSDLAEEARHGLSTLAEEKFRNPLGGTARPDAVTYCLTALETYAKMPIAQLQQVVYEIAMVGAGGLKINDPSRKYRLRSLPGEAAHSGAGCGH